MDIPFTTGTLAPNNASQTKYGSLQTSPAVTKNPQAKTHEFESVDFQHVQSMAPITPSRRSVSCFELGSPERRYRTIHIGHKSKEMQRLAQANVAQLLKTATSPLDASSNNALLARKALRFRKIWTAEAEPESVPASCS